MLYTNYVTTKLSIITEDDLKCTINIKGEEIHTREDMHMHTQNIFEMQCSLPQQTKQWFIYWQF